tara:strand:- start:14615 stop:15517 length:903 start_codon:yes stop_codon:yes gene_type:complete
MPPAHESPTGSAASEVAAPAEDVDVAHSPETSESADEASEPGDHDSGPVEPVDGAAEPVDEASEGPRGTEPVDAADGAPLTRRRARERTGNTDAVVVAGSDGDHRSPFVSTPSAAPEEHPISQAAAGLSEHEPVERGIVSPQLGSALLASIATEPDPRPSFDQLISRPAGGSTGTGSALIVTDSPPQGITAPVNATGEVLVTGSLALPDLFATTGQMPGAAEGLDIDATFADGELPQHSSPTPIAASAAISTVKTTAEIIKPPVPEKGSRLMLTLAITAGVLALALVGVLILAFATGVFS